MPTETEHHHETVSAPDHAPPAGKKPLAIGMAAALGMLVIILLSLPACNQAPAGPDGASSLPPATTGVHRNEVAVYFSKTQGSQSIVENVARPLPASGDMAKGDSLRYALTELLEGPTGEERARGFYSEIPRGTKLLGLTYDNHTVTVNLSGQFASGGGSTTMQQRLNELKQTVYATDTRHTLKVAVEGKPLDTLGGEGLEVPGTVERTPQ